jgi:dUTP pyrophosphatase
MFQKKKIKVKLLHINAKIPSKNSLGSAGFDLYASDNSTIPGSYIDEDRKLNIGRAIIHTGIALQLPAGTVGKVASRSGLSMKNNIEVGAGWIDSDYRGELLVELKNFSSDPYAVSKGDRIAQLVVINITDAKLIVVEKLDPTPRGEKGLGSSGT